MQNSKEKLFNSSFSHIYIEKEALNYTNTKKILQHFNKAKVIQINHYKDVFSRSHQNFVVQKKSPKLILAVKKDNLIYKGAAVCEDFGNDYFYYTSNMMNCIYDCEYCYLQGMYSSSNIVIFVNIEDILKETKKLLENHKVYLCISYDTDILAFENVTEYASTWIDFTKSNKDLTIEIRTKSDNFKSIENIKPDDNVILAWTLSPDEVINKYEHKTPSINARLLSIKNAINKGWKVRICFDPMLYIEDWKEKYKELVDNTFKKLGQENINDVSIGVFRVSKEYLKKMRKQRNNSIILNYPFETINGVCSYSKDMSKQMIAYTYELTKKYMPEDKIYI
ncbi:radical SAM protein [Clostridium sp. P21]|uniref:Radical SAM protein n=1 Tax=Clostridium muellerianum TaxID=2716538 RepID=A0A7Y0EFZ0_9CLOT|nr:radical SAM protein [Clostridium muellerianum]NMM62786.1 radical SAM protein [Clostridium muellerianum]